MTYGGGSLWVTQLFGGDVPNDSTVTQVDPQSGAEHTIQLVPEAAGLAWSEGYGDLGSTISSTAA